MTRVGSEALSSSRQGRSRAAWTLIDQVIVSVRNFAMLFLVIKSSSPSVVGAFGLVYTGYFLAMAIVRGLAGDPLVVRFSGAPQPRWARATSESLAAVIVLSLVGAVLLTCPLAFSQGEVYVGLCALGWSLFALLAQDHLRLAMFARARPVEAAVNDLVVLAVSLVCFAALWQSDHVTIPSVLAAWAVASVVGAALGLRTLRVGVAWSGWRGWLKGHRDLGPAFAADAVANRGTEQLGNIAVGAIAGLSALGAITTCRTLFAPLTTVQTGVNAFLMPEVSRRVAANDLGRLRGMVHGAAWSLGAVMMLTGVALALVPDSVGVDLLGPNWQAAIAIVVPMTVFSALNAIGFGYWAAMKALARARRVLVVRTVGGLSGVVATTIGALHGAGGAVWGMSCGAMVTASWLCWDFHREVGERKGVTVVT